MDNFYFSLDGAAAYFAVLHSMINVLNVVYEPGCSSHWSYFPTHPKDNCSCKLWLLLIITTCHFISYCDHYVARILDPKCVMSVFVLFNTATMVFLGADL
ncbi:hypothetical protein CEXT_192721 [Caerostris extrusa]|uniref:Uncharacterized protein n=1 Tax=Caerostris extrusa TaxID=172846 RepID=A0AAV4SSZ0_CAEEX|nr:hypothetical protein CEXT_192721 [Caerostris extrusa]